jgi:hypothetical protein
MTRALPQKVDGSKRWMVASVGAVCQRPCLQKVHSSMDCNIILPCRYNICHCIPYAEQQSLQHATRFRLSLQSRPALPGHIPHTLQGHLFVYCVPLPMPLGHGRPERRDLQDRAACMKSAMSAHTTTLVAVPQDRAACRTGQHAGRVKQQGYLSCKTGRHAGHKMSAQHTQHTHAWVAAWRDRAA